MMRRHTLRVLSLLLLAISITAGTASHSKAATAALSEVSATYGYGTSTDFVAYHYSVGSDNASTWSCKVESIPTFYDGDGNPLDSSLYVINNGTTSGSLGPNSTDEGGVTLSPTVYWTYKYAYPSGAVTFKYRYKITVQVWVDNVQVAYDIAYTAYSSIITI